MKCLRKHSGTNAKRQIALFLRAALGYSHFLPLRSLLLVLCNVFVFDIVQCEAVVEVLVQLVFLLLVQTDVTKRNTAVCVIKHSLQIRQIQRGVPADLSPYRYENHTEFGKFGIRQPRNRIDADLGEQRVDDAGLQRGEDVLPDQAEHGHGRHREEEEQGTGEVTAEELAVEHHSQRQGDHGDEHGGGHRVQQREAEAREQRRILEALHVVREPHELRVREIVTGVIGEAEHQALQEWDEDHHDEHHQDRQQEACRGEVLHEVAVTTLLEMQRLYLISGMWTRR